VKFLIDMPVTPDAVPHLQRLGHEAVHVSTIGLAMVGDTTILAAASETGAVVVTADLDYPRLLALLHATSPGVILIRGGSYSDAEMLSLLDRVLDQISEPDLTRSILVVDRHRIRRRQLPIVAN
jgi:predicted nuclease of predicted toxin-antitoxin system